MKGMNIIFNKPFFYSFKETKLRNYSIDTNLKMKSAFPSLAILGDDEI